MSWHMINSAVCPCCGRDVARCLPAPDGYRVICDPELMGCGAEGAAGDTETEALTIWNAGLYASAGRRPAA